METTTIQINELTKEQLGNRQTVRENSSRTNEEIILIPLDKIVIREGFNVRQDYGNLEELADSILNNGQLIPGRVDCLEDGTFVLTDGHRRFEALKTLVEHGYEPSFKAIVNPMRTTEEQRILQMFISQDNKQLTPHETAELFSRLSNIGYSIKDIAGKVGKSQPYVSQMLEYSKESPIIKEAVKEGHMTVGAVNALRKQIPSPSERVSAVKDAVEKKKTNNTTKKVSSKAIVGDKEETKKAKAIVKKVLSYLELELEDQTELVEIVKKMV